MRHSRIFGLCILFGAVIVAALAEENMVVLALFMGAALGATIAVMIVAFPLDLSYREPLRGKREVHVVMVQSDQRKR